MTREKKEILKQLDRNALQEAADEMMGDGCLPAWVYEMYARENGRLEERLAHLRHFDSVEAMYLDPRGLQPGEDVLPFF